MTDTVRREYVAEVQSIGQQSGGDGWVLAMAPRQGMKYPDSFYGRDAAIVKDLKPGQHYTFVLERGRLKKNKAEGSTNPFDYFENILEVKAAPAEAPATAPSQAQPTAGNGRASEFRSPAEIIRGVALEQATRLAVALVAAGEPVRSPQVIIIASKYEHYIVTGEIPALPEPPMASPSPSTGGASTTPAGGPVPAGGQPGPQGKAGVAAATPDAEWDGLPSAAHPAASPGMFANWPKDAPLAAQHVARTVLTPNRLEATGFLKFASGRTGRNLTRNADFASYEEMDSLAREYVAAQQATGGGQ